jgi:predicted amidohydrolase
LSAIFLLDSTLGSEYFATMFQLQVGIVTMDPIPWQLEENFQRMETHVREAVRRRAQLVIAPESVLDGYVCGADPDTTREQMLRVAQTVPDGPYLVRAGKLSKELGIYLIFGFLEKAGEELFNCCALYDPQGKLIATYRKVHPTNETGITPGRELKPFDTPLGRVAFLICNDASVPENFSALASQQVDIVFIPNNGGAHPPVMQMLRQRARDTACWIVLANTCSCAIISARGELYLEKYESECVSVQRMDLFDSPRKDDPGLYAPAFMGRRPDLYGPLTRSTEPKVLFDEQGRPTALEEEQRARWLRKLREFMGG